MLIDNAIIWKKLIEFKSEKFVITPTEPVCLSGYGNSNKYTSIADDLEINIILLKQKKQSFVLFQQIYYFFQMIFAH